MNSLVNDCLVTTLLDNVCEDVMGTLHDQREQLVSTRRRVCVHVHFPLCVWPLLLYARMSPCVELMGLYSVCT